MKTIKLTRGKVALVDDLDYEELAKYTWHCTSAGYASRSEKGNRLYMHRVILGVADPKQQVDHADGNRLNNQRNNLRLATSSQQQANSPKEKGKTSRFKGVTWNETGKQWVASIIAGGQSTYLGIYKTQEAAALAYNVAAIAHFGAFALLNQFTEEEKAIALSHPPPKPDSSRFTGVSWYKRGKTWRAWIWKEGKMIHLGYFKKEVEAALAHNQAIREHFGEEHPVNELTEEEKGIALVPALKRSVSSRFKGVVWDKRSQRWLARIWVNKKNVHLGDFVTEEAAAYQYNQKAKELLGDAAYLNPLTKEEMQVALTPPPQRGSSQYLGVSWHKATSKWVAQIQVGDKKVYLGLYDTEQEAAKAYNQKAIELHGDKAKLNQLE